MQMDFIVDKQTKTVSITKEFAYNLSLVWDAYTKPELLDQWWAPKPWTSRTKVIDFKVGGRRFYLDALLAELKQAQKEERKK